jgi:hypothetical protein
VQVAGHVLVQVLRTNFRICQCRRSLRASLITNVFRTSFEMSFKVRFKTSRGLSFRTSFSQVLEQVSKLKVLKKRTHQNHSDVRKPIVRLANVIEA